MEINILNLARNSNQEHLVEHYDTLTDQKAKEDFLNQMKGIDFEQANILFKNVYLESKEAKEAHKC